MKEKQLYLIGGTMGAGKTTVGRILKKQLPDCVFLDGDWCWDMDPFQVTEETKKMVMKNIIFLLNSFLTCSAYKNVVFCWVMHEQAIIDEILGSLDLNGCQVHLFSLICSPKELAGRLEKDIEQGFRDEDVVNRSLARLPFYEKLNTIKIDTTGCSPKMVAERITKASGRKRWDS